MYYPYFCSRQTVSCRVYRYAILKMLGQSLPESAIDSFPGSLSPTDPHCQPPSLIAICVTEVLTFLWIFGIFMSPAGLHSRGYRLSDLNTLDCLRRRHRRSLEYLLIYEVHIYLLFTCRYIRDIRTEDPPRNENL